MTRKLYDDSPYEREFQARVVSCKRSENRPDTWEVVLDATLFFPEEGGQTPDMGTLGGFSVADVQIRDGIITHTLVPPAAATPEAPAVGDTVTGCIDWEHRFSNMQQHTGEHIFSGLVHRQYGYDNVGFHLSDHIVTMDYNGSLSAEQIRELELEANRVIAQNLPVYAEYPGEERLAGMEYRCKKELAPPIRIVTITDVDVCACCAPHVRSTAEVGILKVMDVTNYKGGVRLSILCGMRAFLAFRGVYEMGRELSHLTSRPMGEVTDALRSLQAENGAYKQRLNEAAAALLAQEVKEAEIGMKAEDAVFFFTENADIRIIRNMVNDLMERHHSFCGIFSATGEGTYTYLIGSRHRDCSQLARGLNAAFSGKGGGKPQMVQGSVCGSEADIRRWLAALPPG